jgi:hypothetical protein
VVHAGIVGPSPLTRLRYSSGFGCPAPVRRHAARATREPRSLAAPTASRSPAENEMPPPTSTEGSSREHTRPDPPPSQARQPELEAEDRRGEPPPLAGHRSIAEGAPNGNPTTNGSVIATSSMRALSRIRRSAGQETGVQRTIACIKRLLLDADLRTCYIVSDASTAWPPQRMSRSRAVFASAQSRKGRPMEQYRSQVKRVKLRGVPLRRAPPSVPIMAVLAKFDIVGFDILR